jgi:hypothetical protein
MKMAKEKSRVYAVWVIEWNFREVVDEFGILKTIWGYDIFLNGVPFLKSIVLANVIVWIILSL